MKRFVLLLVLMAGLKLVTLAQENDQAKMIRYTKVPTGYLMVLREGDDVLEEIGKLAVAEKIPSANFSGMGFVSITFGFFDVQRKKYDPKEFKGVELVNMLGSIAWKEGEVSIHSHGMIGDRSYRAFGGHILKATVGQGSAEILVTLHDKTLQRVRDEKIGADVLALGGN